MVVYGAAKAVSQKPNIAISSLLNKSRVIAVACMVTASLVACDAGQAVEEDIGSDNSAGDLLHSCQQSELEFNLGAQDLQCGSIQVPENPADPDGRQIPLNIVRAPAIAAKANPDPLFIFAGGPGQAATELWPLLRRFASLVNENRDVVMIDQRGTGKSNPLDCSMEDLEIATASIEEAKQLQIDRLKECLADYDADVRYYTTPIAADDFDAVRRALGYEKINLWGASYGTRMALVYMRRHPDSVRTSIIDSVAPFDLRLPYHMFLDADNALKRLFAVCKQDVACNQRYPDLETSTRQLIKSLDTDPKQVTVENTQTGENTTFNMSGQILSALIRLGLYSREIGPLIPYTIDAVSQGDYRPISSLLNIASTGDAQMSAGMFYSVMCAADIGRGDNGINISIKDPVLQLDVTSGMQAICDFWPHEKLPASYFEPVISDLPTLVLSGSLDPVTPPEWGEKAASTLSKSLHIEVAGAHHNVSSWGCVPNLIQQFIEEATVSNLDTECTNKIKPFPAFTSPAGPSMSAMSVVDENQKEEDSDD